MDDTLDFTRVASELVRALRGTRSQTALSRKLGYRTNQLYRWEAGLRSPSWEDFIKLCHAVDVPIEKHLKEVFVFTKNPNKGSLLVKYLMQELPIARVALLTGLSRFSLSRWSSQKTEPGLSDLLMLMHKLWNLLFVFLDGWVAPEELPSLGTSFKYYRREKELFYKRPICTAILESLKLEEYKILDRHSDAWVANSANTDEGSVHEILSELHSIGLISKKAGKFELVRSFSSMNGNFLLYKNVRKFWFQNALDFYEKRKVVPEHSIAPAMVFSCSNEAMQSIVGSYRNFLTEMQEIIAKDSAPFFHLFVHSTVLMELNGKD